MKKRPIIDRFLEKIAVQVSGCWDWTGSISTNGYGFLWDGKNNVRAHRFAYEYFTNFLIPINMEIDHLCRNHQCVNPDHLEVVSHRENVLRGINPTLLGNRRRSITHCLRGHLYVEESTYIDSGGYRACKICKRASNRQSYHKLIALKGEECLIKQ